jgi:hypothetical protein
LNEGSPNRLDSFFTSTRERPSRDAIDGVETSGVGA